MGECRGQYGRPEAADDESRRSIVQILNERANSQGTSNPSLELRANLTILLILAEKARQPVAMEVSPQIPAGGVAKPEQVVPVSLPVRRELLVGLPVGVLNTLQLPKIWHKSIRPLEPAFSSQQCRDHRFLNRVLHLTLAVAGLLRHACTRRTAQVKPVDRYAGEIVEFLARELLICGALDLRCGPLPPEADLNQLLTEFGAPDSKQP